MGPSVVNGVWGWAVFVGSFSNAYQELENGVVVRHVKEVLLGNSTYANIRNKTDHFCVQVSPIR